MQLSFDAKAICAVQNILTVTARKIAFGEAEIINGIEQIRFAYAIRSANAGNPGIELKSRLCVILKLVN